MKLLKNGKDTLVSVENINKFGFWILVNGKEYFLNYDVYPYFKDENVAHISNVKLLHETHLSWPELDVDLEIDNLENPEKYPLISQVKERQKISVK